MRRPEVGRGRPRFEQTPLPGCCQVRVNQEFVNARGVVIARLKMAQFLSVGSLTEFSRDFICKMTS